MGGRLKGGENLSSSSSSNFCHVLSTAAPAAGKREVTTIRVEQKRTEILPSSEGAGKMLLLNDF